MKISKKAFLILCALLIFGFIIFAYYSGVKYGEGTTCQEIIKQYLEATNNTYFWANIPT